MHLRWSPLTLRDSGDSIYGNVAVLELDAQQMVYQNGIPSIYTPLSRPGRAGRPWFTCRFLRIRTRSGTSCGGRGVWAERLPRH